MCEGIGKFSIKISEVEYETEFNLCDGNNDEKAVFNLPTIIPDKDSDYYNLFLDIACHDNSACLLSLNRS